MRRRSQAVARFVKRPSRRFGVGFARRTVAAVAMLLVIAGAHCAALADTQLTEYQIKVAFLCKFGNFVEWPLRQAAASDSAFGIGVVASDAVVDELTRAARGQMVNGRPITVRRLARGDPVDGIAIIFVARTHAGRLEETLGAVQGPP